MLYLLKSYVNGEKCLKIFLLGNVLHTATRLIFIWQGMGFSDFHFRK